MLTIAVLGFAYDRLFLWASRRLLHWKESTA
jgi:ABC-type nitrate/sulfonate/bicarbonate transport system permease component